PISRGRAASFRVRARLAAHFAGAGGAASGPGKRNASSLFVVAHWPRLTPKHEGGAPRSAAGAQRPSAASGPGKRTASSLFVVAHWPRLTPKHEGGAPRSAAGAQRPSAASGPERRTASSSLV